MIKISECDKLRFWKKVEKVNGKCWNTHSFVEGNIPSSFRFRGKTYSSPRFSWIMHFGEIPVGMCICHTCDNRRCVNPDHLFLGTHKQNMEDKVKKGRAFGRFKTLSKKEATEIKTKIAQGVSTLKLAIDYNVSRWCIMDIKRGRTFGYIDVEWIPNYQI